MFRVDLFGNLSLPSTIYTKLTSNIKISTSAISPRHYRPPHQPPFSTPVLSLLGADVAKEDAVVAQDESAVVGAELDVVEVTRHVVGPAVALPALTRVVGVEAVSYTHLTLPTILLV